MDIMTNYFKTIDNIGNVDRVDARHNVDVSD